MKILKWALSGLLAIAVAATLFPIVALADPDGTEIQITDQPDKLILQLGPEWAGVEFELKTDAGVFPVPVVVDETGVLRMDLGGSKTYTLSCLASPVAVPNPNPTVGTAAPVSSPSPTPAVSTGSGNTTEADQKRPGIPTGTLVLFLLGFVAAVGGLLTMRYFKRRHNSYDRDGEDGYDE
ncbi:MAG: hypothetical protein FWC62_04465 [Firmicutes bacterium]|nr:hypothetical protein [Bacillota bacterium]